MSRAREDLLVAARALMAYRRGESSPLALTGAVLEAEVFAAIRTFFTGQ